ncbi:MAG: autotransporter domain-containing protein [Lysobacter sp.]
MAIALALTGAQASAETIDDGASVVVPTDRPSPWNIQEAPLQVGIVGQGRLRIENGGVVTVGKESYIGNAAGSRGEVVVDGAGSAWSSRSVSIAFAGSAAGSGNGGGEGAVTVANGARLDVGSALNLGARAGSRASLNIVGGGQVRVGSSETFGSVAAGLEGGQGDILVDGAQSLLQTFSPGGYSQLKIGDSGKASLTVSNGGSVITDSLTSGVSEGGDALVQISGAGSSLRSGYTSIGEIGRATLTVSDQGALLASQLNLGVDAGGEGTMRVSGAGSKVEVSDADIGGITIGNDGRGSLTVADGATVTTRLLNLGNSETARGDLSVTGAGSILNAGYAVYIGSRGQGSVRVENGGRIASGVTYLGGDEGSVGTATVTGAGSSWISDSSLYIAYGSQGSMIVEQGATVRSTDLFIGGNGNTDTDYGVGLLEILSGAKVYSGYTSLGSPGNDGGGGGIGGEGRVLIDGAGSLLNLTNDRGEGAGMTVGSGGKGELIVRNGARLEGGYLTVGDYKDEGGEASVLVSGAGSSLQMSGRVEAYNRPIRIENGATASSGSLELSNALNRAPTVFEVTGAGSGMTVSDTVRLAANTTLTVANGAKFATRDLILGGSGSTDNVAGAGSILNIGAAPGQAPAQIGSFVADTIVSNRSAAADAAINLNHTSAHFVLAAQLQGKATLNQLAGVTELTGQSKDFAGVVNVSGGELRVNGTLGGTVAVGRDARLSGAGTIGSTVIGAGATVAPGNSIGTLNVNGDLRFEAGSIYRVEANPQGPDSDRINVTGSASLAGGSLVHVGPDGTFKPGVVYTVLNAGGGVSGRFQGASSDFAFLEPELSYDANNVYLGLVRNRAQFQDYALTRNQKATSRGIAGTGSGHAVFDAVVKLPDDGALVRAAYDNLSGEIHAGAKSALFDDSRYIREAALARADAGSDGEFWLSVLGARAKYDSDGNADRLDRSSSAVLIGLDRAVGDSWRLGVAAGYGRDDLDADARRSSAKLDGYSIAAYAGARVNGFGARFGAAYAWHDIDSTRHIAFPGLAETARAKYDADTAQAFAEIGYRFERATSNLEPFLGLSYLKVETDPYRENGQAGLVAQRERMDATFTTLGLRADQSVAFGTTAAKFRGLIGWRHALDETVPTATHAFSAGGAFTVAGVPIARNTAVVEAGLELQVTQRIGLAVDYSGQIASDSKDHGLQARLQVSF